ncbi:MAG: hypothetical protein KBS66_05900 [Eubacterium sp.]|nr:hypothetical protein [Candidatus Colimonas fimequi]
MTLLEEFGIYIISIIFHSTKDAQQGISREVDLIKKLARKRYLKKRHKLLDREHSIIKEMLEILAEDPAYDKIQKCVDKLAMAKLNISETTWTPQQIEANGKQSENPYKREELRYSTNGGIMVRNMAEKMWGDLYELLGIPYQYEKGFRLDVTELTGVTGTTEYNGRLYKTYYPDFTLFMADGSIIIHEHLGFIHHKEYRDKVGEKFIAYTHNGLVSHESLLVTYPKDVKNSSAFRALLNTFVIPRV